MKKIFVVLLVCVMLISTAAVAFAADEDTENRQKPAYNHLVFNYILLGNIGKMPKIVQKAVQCTKLLAKVFSKIAIFTVRSCVWY